MSEENLSYSNAAFGTCTLAEDKIEWVKHGGKKGEMAYADVLTVHLGEAATGGPSSMGQASLVGDIGGTTATTISGTSGSDANVDVSAYEMKLKSDTNKLTINMDAIMDDAAAFLAFVKALHEKITAANPSAKFSAGEIMGLIAAGFICVVLLVLAAGAVFVGIAVGWPILIGIGAVLAIGAVAVLFFGVKKFKPKTYDPLNIPADLLPS